MRLRDKSTFGFFAQEVINFWKLLPWDVVVADSINSFPKGLERLTVNKVHNQMVKAEMCPLTETNTKDLWTQV